MLLNKLSEVVLLFYDNFIRLCALNGISPSVAAEKIGFDRSAVTGWKKGSKPKDINIQKIADYFGVSPEELTGSTGPAQRKAPVNVSNSDTQSEGQLMAAFFEGGEDLSEEEMAALWQDAKDYIQWKLSQRRKAKDDQ